jgi:hypothetical protein
MHRRFLNRLAFTASLVALSLGTSAPPASASVTIGQTGTPGGGLCSDPIDWVQATVTSGNAYVVPATGGISAWTVISWSTQAGAGGGRLTMKIYRPLGGRIYMVVGHDGPHSLLGGVLNTFTTTSIAVKAGDVLGSSTPSDSGFPACTLSGAPGDLILLGDGDPLADGQSGTFSSEDPDFRLNVSAVITPTNTFTLGAVSRNKKKGTATLTVEDVPNPGTLALTGNGLKTASAAGAVVAKTVTAPGDVKLKIRAKGKKKRKLNETGKVKVKPKITFTPTGGDPSTQATKVKLKKR